MKFSRQIQLIEQLLDRVVETTDDENIGEISEELLQMKKEEVAELVEASLGICTNDKEFIETCWAGYLLGEM